MKDYKNKQDLIDEINKAYEAFFVEFAEVNESEIITN